MSELIYLAVPTRGMVDHHVAARVAEIGAALFTAPVYQAGHVSAGMTRNQIVHKFLASDCGALLMIDDDVLPKVDQIPGLVARVADEGWDVAAGAYPIFKPENGWPLPVPAAFHVTDDSYDLVAPKMDGIEEVDAVGTGCVVISRRVLEQIEVPFAEAMMGDQIVSDDFVFCRQARDLGFRIGLDWGVRCDHICRISLGKVLEGFHHFAAQQAGAKSRIIIPGR